MPPQTDHQVCHSRKQSCHPQRKTIIHWITSQKDHKKKRKQGLYPCSTKGGGPHYRCQKESFGLSWRLAHQLPGLHKEEERVKHRSVIEAEAIMCSHKWRWQGGGLGAPHAWWGGPKNTCTHSIPGYLPTWYNVNTWVLFTVHAWDTWIHNGALCSVNTWFALRTQLNCWGKKVRPAENPCTMETIEYILRCSKHTCMRVPWVYL